MDTETAAAILSRFLAPRVRGWLAVKRERGELEAAFLCGVCYAPAFTGTWCLSCREHKARDPTGFAQENLLCQHCFGDEGCDGCTERCQGWQDEMNRRADDEGDYYNRFNEGHRSKRKYSWD